jgi:mercuric ion binding protein
MRSIVLILVFLMPFLAKADDKEVTFKSSINCNMCKEKIEGDLPLTKGVKKVTVNVEEKTITVVYNDGKTDEAKIKKAISKIGYDADDVVANQKSHDRLPKCCQKSQTCTH